MKIISWNVNGIRAATKKGFAEFIERETPDITCVQETKVSEDVIPSLQLGLDSYAVQYSSAEKKGYSGVATFCRKQLDWDNRSVVKGIGIPDYDREGRFLISEHEDILLYNVYVPSGTTGDIRQQVKYEFLDAFLEHLTSLPQRNRDRLVICGDFNICHREIDIHHPDVATKRELSGFLPDERAWMDRFVDTGFVDSFRLHHGNITDRYSWWSYRAGARKKNLGWRIDYCFVAEALAGRIIKADILQDVEGSDHCPILLELQ